MSSPEYRQRRRTGQVAGSLSVLFLVFFGGCGSPTEQDRGVHPARLLKQGIKPSGFLTDYNLLHKGKKGEPILVYRNPEADFQKYKTAYVDDVAIWRTAEMEEIPQFELEQLAFEFRTQIRVAVRKHFEVVDEPASGSLKVRAALTSAEKSSGALSVWTSVGIVGRTISRVKKIATGTHAFVGGATAELEIVDIDTGEVLVAAVDRRIGTKSWSGAPGSSWGDVENAMKAWGEQLDAALGRFLAGS